MNKLPRDRRRKVFERVVNPLLIKYMTSNPADVCIAANIPIKYLPYFKEVSASRRAKRIRYRYRGTSKPGYKRPQSFCHMNHADTFAIYYR
tara:strand:+ start:195 stop:467 length:273 start_codon:yes stop_codon:yes gene_type:complete